MELSRREFLKLGGAGVPSILALETLGFDWVFAAYPKDLSVMKKRIGEKTTICPYCGVGCSAIMAVEDGRITNLEGDPDSPINEGSLCPKGASLHQVANNEGRLTRVQRRAVGAGL